MIKGDAIINDAQRGVSRLISVTIATQQPVARDLRYLLTLDHVTYELERIGDHAASVAKQVREAGARSRPSRATSTCPRWPSAARHARPRRAARPGRVGRGPAREVAVEDDEIDRLYHATFDEVRRADARPIRPTSSAGTRIVIASHYLERIGDRATNIAEDVVYLVTGDVEDLNP